MEDFLTAEDYELWTIINQDPLIPSKQNAQSKTVLKDPLRICDSRFQNDGEEYKG